jgi:hypothetical protein
LFKLIRSPSGKVVNKVATEPVPLFRPLPEDARAALEALPAVLDAAMPSSAHGAHRRDLPQAVRELSALLTFARGDLGRPYWSAPRLASAYARYFLPWNLIRLIRLLPGLNLPAPGPETLVADLGSGPLTMPLALWLAFPGWRDVPLRITAVDSSSRALDLGREIFLRLAPGSPWRIRTLRAPLHKALRMLDGRPRLITLGNVLNELAGQPGDRAGNRAGGRGDERGTGRMADLTGLLSRLEDGGAVCAVEPGTRLGALALEQLRAGGIAAGLWPSSPCTHNGPCPLLEKRPGRHRNRGWCHAVMDARQAPAWLHELARAAGLAKTSLSLSHLVLHAGGAIEREPCSARILSDAFAVPGLNPDLNPALIPDLGQDLGQARYACTAQGLALLVASDGAAGTMISQGALVRVRPVHPPRTDARSGARMVTLETSTQEARSTGDTRRRGAGSRGRAKR